MISRSLLGILPCTLYGKKLESEGSWLYLHLGFLVTSAERTGNGILYPVAGEQVALLHLHNLLTGQEDGVAVLPSLV